jgi:hypothetical protein
MAKYDITGNTEAVDSLLERTDNPLHRQILENWRRHMLLEISGNWPDIFAPDRTVRDPDYRMFLGGELTNLRGLDEVGSFYEGITKGGRHVIVITNQNIVVNDGGFAQNVSLTQFYRGHELAEEGHQGLDDDKWYSSEMFVVEFWPYTDQGLLVGEYVAQMGPAIIREIDESDVVTPDAARVALEPLLRPIPVFQA